MKKFILGLISLMIMLTGCETVKRKNIIVLIDNSNSVPLVVMQRYINTIINTIVPNMGTMDRLTIQFIDGCSQEKGERIYMVDLALTDFSKKTDGINRQADSSRARLVRYLEKVKTEIAGTVLSKRAERKDCGQFTDIISAVNEAGKLFVSTTNYHSSFDKLLNSVQGEDNYTYENALVIFSDMVNEEVTKNYDFTTIGGLDKNGIEHLITRLNTEGKIPQLKQFKVLVYGATSTVRKAELAGRQIEHVKLFWSLFFSSANANLEGYGYDSQIELTNYLSANH